MTENDIAKLVVDLCFKIHKQYGQDCLRVFMKKYFVMNGRKMVFPLRDNINDKVILELKSIEALAEVHYKQVQTYLKLTGLKLGLLVNFNVPLIKGGIHRIVNNL